MEATKKKKLLRAAGIIIAALAAVVVALSLFVNYYLRSERIKPLISSELESRLNRKVIIGKVDISVFKGISLKDLSIREKEGTGDFVLVREFVMNYSFFPLLKKRLVITKFELNSPSIELSRERDGRYNFSDILEQTEERQHAVGETGKGMPLSIATDRMSIKNARLTFIDKTGQMPDAVFLSDMELRLSPEPDRAAPALTGKIHVKELTLKTAGREINGKAEIGIGSQKTDFNATASLGKDIVQISGDIKELEKGPVVVMNISAKELDLQNLLSFSSAPATKRQAKIDGRGDEKAGKPSGGAAASGMVKVATAKYGEYILSDFSAQYGYGKGKLTINPITARIAGGGPRVTLDGTIKGDLLINGMEKETLQGKISADLSRLEMSGTKLTTQIASVTGIPELSHPKFDRTSFLFLIAHQKIALKGDMASPLVTLNPAGTVGFDKKVLITADLRTSPSLTGRMMPSGFTRYIKDDKGWTVIPLKITGTTDKPVVGLNQAAVGKQVQRALEQDVGKKVLKGFFK